MSAPEKNCFCDGSPPEKQTAKSRQTSATPESRIVAQRQRIIEKFEIQTHEQLVALASQVAVWPDTNRKNMKASGDRKHRVRPPVDVNEIKKMRADGTGPTAIAKTLKPSICL